MNLAPLPPTAPWTRDPRIHHTIRTLPHKLAQADPCVQRLAEYAVVSRTPQDLAWLLTVALRILAADHHTAEYAAVNAVLGEVTITAGLPHPAATSQLPA